MVAYSFKAQFEAPIVHRTKLGTIRAQRRRHARAGETLQLYMAMRTKYCRLVATAQCISNDLVRLDFKAGVILVDFQAENCVMNLCSDDKLNEFARGDGFADFEAMAKFWSDEHDASTFEGRWIQWHASSVIPAPRRSEMAGA